jgi:transcriptional regulator with XRE-family HTH domain
MKQPKKKPPHSYLIALGAEVKRIRIQKNLSLEALGVEIGLDAPNMQKIEAGQNLTVNTLLKICICLGTTPSKIFDKISWDLTYEDIDSLSKNRN